MTQLNIKPRLQIYHSLVGKYDLLDKYKFSKERFTSIKCVKLLYLSNKFNVHNLNIILFKEFLSQQHLKIKNSLYRTSLITTLRNSLMFLYLEFLLNSIFLNTKLSFSFFSSTLVINLILNFLSGNEFLVFLSEVSSERNNFFKLTLMVNFCNSNVDLSSFLVYYFVPLLKF